MAGTLLIVDDEKEMGESLREIFSAEGFQVLYTADPQRALDFLDSYAVNLILMDVRMPKIGGIDLLQQVRSHSSDIPVIMISGYASVDMVVRSMKYGAVNFYEKPVDIPTLLEEVRPWMRRLPERKDGKEQDLITANPQMREIYQIVETAAPTRAPVIITGESGTGKERIAAAIHERSNRRDKLLVKINCAAIPDTLLESELFGHEAGAFTDARQSRVGKFEASDGGTIFFDEIGDMSLKIQAKLLRVFQEKEFERLGSNTPLRSDVRILAATNKDLESMIDQGLFREDLYYRISVITIHLPPLRDRMEDLPSLLRFSLREYAERYSKEVEDLSPEAETMLLSHDWPGNIRELKNTVERAVIFSKGKVLELRDFPSRYRTSRQESEEKTNRLDHIVGTLSRRAILDALRQSKGSRSMAAEFLGINRKTLYNRMKKYGI